MASPGLARAFDRRTLLKAGAAVGAVQIASPFIIAARGEDPDQDRHGRSADRRLCRPRADEVEGAKYAVDDDQQEGRHSRPPGRASGRGLRQRRRHRRAEDPQADRARQGRLHHRRRQLRHRLRDGAGHQREEGAAHRPRRPHRRDHRQGLQVERLSASAIPPRWMPPPSPASWSSKFGKKWFFITPDYAYGHTLQDSFVKNLKKLGGTVTGATGCRSTPPTSRPP